MDNSLRLSHEETLKKYGSIVDLPTLRSRIPFRSPFSCAFNLRHPHQSERVVCISMSFVTREDSRNERERNATQRNFFRALSRYGRLLESDRVHVALPHTGDDNEFEHGARRTVDSFS